MGPEDGQNRSPFSSSGHGSHSDFIPKFFGALFRHVPPGSIEVRAIEDGQGGKLLDRAWYPSAGPLSADLPGLALEAEQHGIGLFFGVLPRRAEGSGTAADTTPGLTLWADVDFKDYAGGEAEARQRIAELHVPPSIIVRSGHGLHLYWLLIRPTDPTTIVGLNRRIAKFIGADHAFDAARVLRIPGTMNMKDPAHPILVEIEELESGRRHEPEEFATALDSVGASAECAQDPTILPDLGPIEIAAELSARVQAIFDRHPQALGYFDGRGKPALGEDGKALDRSSSGFDFSLAMALAKRGATPSEIATAIDHRPDGAARSKGIRYIERTVRNALARFEATQSKTGPGDLAAPDFTIERVRVFQSNPPLYEIVVEGVPFRLTSAELKAKNKFALRFMDALRRIPLLPEKADAWRTIVNGWLEKAEIVEMPPEASEEFALREAIEDAIQNLRLGEDVIDLDRGAGVRLEDGNVVFKTRAILAALRDEHPDLKANVICRVLRDLGYGSQTPKVGDKAVRVWVKQ